jgi:succinyl-diaminopimelate desuccinylase
LRRGRTRSILRIKLIKRRSGVDVIDGIRERAALRRDAMIELQRLLTSVPAIGPQSGGTGEWDKGQALIGRLPGLGFPAHQMFASPDSRVPGGKRPNIVVTLPGESDERTLWIMTHLDIVPPGEASLWKSDPYSLVVDGQKLIGRGVEDNQQGLVASLFAASILRELGFTPPCTVKLLFVADEETGSDHGIQYILANTDLFRREDWALVPDSGSVDGSEIEIAEKSILWLKIRTKGRQCHASTPHKGVNAFLAASHLVVRLQDLAVQFGDRDGLFDPPISTFTPTRKEANVPNINTIPGDDVFYLDCRVLPRVDVEAVLAGIRRIAEGVEKDFGVGVEVETVQRASSPPTPADSPLVGMLVRAVKRIYGVEGKTIGIGGGTVGAFLRKKGIHTVVWSRLAETAHMPNEYCLIPNMVGDSAVMAALMMGTV